MSGKPMTKATVVETLAAKTGFTKKDISYLLAGETALAYKGSEELPYHSRMADSFSMNRKTKVGRDPQIGTAIKKKAKKVVKFRVAKTYKDAAIGE